MTIGELCEEVERQAKTYGWDLCERVPSMSSVSMYYTYKRGKQVVIIRVSDHRRNRNTFDHQVLSKQDSDELVLNLWLPKPREEPKSEFDRARYLRNKTTDRMHSRPGM